MSVNQLFRSTKITDQIVVSGGNFFTTVLLARGLGIEDFGIFSWSVLISLFLSSIFMAVVGFPMLTNYELMKDHRDQYLDGNIFLVKYFVNGVMAILLLIIIMYLSLGKFDYVVYLLMVGYGVYSLLHEAIRRVWMVKNNEKKLLQMDLSLHGFRLLFIAILMSCKELNLLTAILIFVASLSVSLYIANYNLKYKFSYKLSSMKLSVIKNWQMGKWLLPSGVMQWLSINLFIIAGGILLSSTALGMIRVCQNLVSFSNVLIQYMDNYLPIVLSKIFNEEGINGIAPYLARFMAVGVFLGGIIIPIVYLMGDWIIEAIYGHEYADSKFLIVGFSILQLFVFIAVPVRVTLRTCGMTKAWFNAYAVTTVASLIIFYPLINELGELGVVMGMLLGYVILLSYSGLSLYKYMKRF